MPARLRPPLPGDAPAVLDVILARDVADLGAPDFTLEDLHADWARPGVDLEHDARVAEGSGGLTGYAILLGDDAVVTVHPRAEGEGAGSLLRGWAEARAGERGTAVLRQFVYGANHGGRRLLGDAGYAPAQHYFRLRAELDAVPPADGAGLRPLAPEDAAAAHALVGKAFEEIEGNTPVTLEEWRAREREGLALEDAEGLAGVAIGRPWPDGTGYVDALAVAGRARGRGYGRRLLLGMFAAFRAAGLCRVELSVNGRNRGALRLYEAAGMHPVWECERWEKALGRA